MRSCKSTQLCAWRFFCSFHPGYSRSRTQTPYRYLGASAGLAGGDFASRAHCVPAWKERIAGILGLWIAVVDGGCWASSTREATFINLAVGLQSRTWRSLDAGRPLWAGVRKRHRAASPTRSMSALGQKRRNVQRKRMSALPPKRTRQSLSLSASPVGGLSEIRSGVSVRRRWHGVFLLPAPASSSRTDSWC